LGEKTKREQEVDGSSQVRSINYNPNEKNL